MFLTRTRDGESPLQLCISESLSAVVGLLCGKGADHNSHPNSPEPPLWQALDSKQEDIASTLVQYVHGCLTHAVKIWLRTG